MKCQIAVLKTESRSCLDGFLQNANLQEMHQEHSVSYSHSERTPQLGWKDAEGEDKERGHFLMK